MLLALTGKTGYSEEDAKCEKIVVDNVRLIMTSKENSMIEDIQQCPLNYFYLNQNYPDDYEFDELSKNFFVNEQDGVVHLFNTDSIEDKSFSLDMGSEIYYLKNNNIYSESLAVETLISEDFYSLRFIDLVNQQWDSFEYKLEDKVENRVLAAYCFE